MPVLPPVRRLMRPTFVALAVVAAALSAPPSVRPACAQGPEAAHADTAWASQPGAVCPARAAETQRSAALLDRLRAQIAASASKDGSAPVALNGSGYNYGAPQRPGTDAALLEFEAKRK